MSPLGPFQAGRAMRASCACARDACLAAQCSGRFSRAARCALPGATGAKQPGTGPSPSALGPRPAACRSRACRHGASLCPCVPSPTSHIPQRGDVRCPRAVGELLYLRPGGAATRAASDRARAPAAHSAQCSVRRAPSGQWAVGSGPEGRRRRERAAYRDVPTKSPRARARAQAPAPAPRRPERRSCRTLRPAVETPSALRAAGAGKVLRRRARAQALHALHATAGVSAVRWRDGTCSAGSRGGQPASQPMTPGPVSGLAAAVQGQARPSKVKQRQGLRVR